MGRDVMFKGLLAMVLMFAMTGCLDGGGSSSASVTPIDSGSGGSLPPVSSHDLVVDFLHLDANQWTLVAAGKLKDANGNFLGLNTDPAVYLSQDGTGLRASGAYTEASLQWTSQFQIDMQNPYKLVLKFRIKKSSLSHDDVVTLRFQGQNGQFHEIRQDLRANESFRLVKYSGSRGSDPTDSEQDGDYCFCRRELLPDIFSFNNSADMNVSLTIEKDQNGQTTITGNYGEGDFYVYPDSIIQPDWATVQLMIGDNGDDMTEGMDITVDSLVYDGGRR